MSAPGQSIAKIEARINDSLESDLEQALGHRYFLDIRFRVARVTLPKNVQAAVDDAQGEFAAVYSAKAELRQARYIARRNRLLGNTYNRSPGLASIEALKAIPQGSTVILSPGGRMPSILAGAGAGWRRRRGCGGRCRQRHLILRPRMARAKSDAVGRWDGPGHASWVPVSRRLTSYRGVTWSTDR